LALTHHGRPSTTLGTNELGHASTPATIRVSGPGSPIQ